MTEKSHIKYKICLLGDGAVGKTSLIRRFVLDLFDDSYIQTIGTKISKKDIKLVLPKEDREILIQFIIWDIMGHHKAEALNPIYFKHTAGGLIVSDTTRIETLYSLSDWVDLLFKESGKVPLLFLGNKKDKEGEFGFNELKEKASEFGAPAFMTSAKTGENVEAVFETLGTMLFQEQ